MAERLGYVVTDFARQIRRVFDQRVRAIGVTGPQARLLLRIQMHPGRNQAQYADDLDIEAITVCRMIDRLEEAGFVERVPDPADRRARLIQLTPRGDEEMKAIAAKADALEAQILEGFTSSQISDYIVITKAMRTNLAKAAECSPDRVRS
ncbi:MarR family winged helix-turn-helix transcriptional regulator [Croceicoccus naphthovorans]|uniref:Uncharacterized protein n=1 Tax=Croceicoccus naphthovorans TaxID=1348774 RepID=A0A0G3XD28_9SPHN|nr:MarR family transcriptional regulator [Croceicoccus naphthovorans]AKM09052.1 hypothetical protein AB433_02240 [Croceicoccus naphthovorans]MBB3991443.1 DNA-binding MarR family transcriptional regulator [Croceicoccus naphthovorans]